MRTKYGPSFKTGKRKRARRWRPFGTAAAARWKRRDVQASLDREFGKASK